MKYFTQYLQEKSTNLASDDCQKYYDIWMKNLKRYWARYQKIKDQLPPNMSNLFESGSFHDSSLVALSFIKDGFNYNISLELLGDDFHGVLIHKSVKEYRLQISDVLECGDAGEYLYGEILKKNNDWTHNFIFCNSSEIFIKCKELLWESL